MHECDQQQASEHIHSVHVTAKTPDFSRSCSITQTVLCSELEGNMRAKDQQLLKAQDSLREAQEDLARDEIIFAGKVKELQEVREANEQLQVSQGTITHQARSS